MTEIVIQQSSGLRSKSEASVWVITLFVWFGVLCFLPDPKPLSAPEWCVRVMQSVFGVSEPGARAVASVSLRGIGLGMLGILVAMSLCAVRLRWAAPLALLAAPLLGIVSQCVNYGYFPIYAQLQIAFVSTLLGALAGLSLRRAWVLVALIVLGVGLYSWVSAVRITDELDAAARATGLHLLEEMEQIPAGDEGFAKLLQQAFAYAEDNSHRSDAVFANRAAILALGVILGEERVADVAGRAIDLNRIEEFRALRARIKLRGRNDLARHFWVSAALAVLADKSRSITVGIAKELMDATHGGSGFSFVDLTADIAGTRFAEAATRNDNSARNLQEFVRRGAISGDFCPDFDGLPEGLTAEQFQNVYGGLGGSKTREMVAEIQLRLESCKGLRGPE